MAHGDIGAQDRRHLLGMERIGDGRGHAGADEHGKEGGVEAVAVGQAEAEIGRTAGGVDLQFLPEPADQVEDAASRLVEGADRHDQRIDDDIGIGDAVIRGALDDLLCHLEAHIGVFRDAGLVIGDGDDRGAVFLHKRQHALQPLLLAGDGVEQRLALVDGESRLEGGDDGGIDGKRHVGQRLHELDRLGQDLRLVRQRDAGIDIEHVGAGLDLGQRIGLDAAVVAGRHLGGQQLAARRIDALPDEHEGTLEADDDLLGRRGDDGVGHVLTNPFPGRTARRAISHDAG